MNTHLALDEQIWDSQPRTPSRPWWERAQSRLRALMASPRAISSAKASRTERAWLRAIPSGLMLLFTAVALLRAGLVLEQSGTVETSAYVNLARISEVVSLRLAATGQGDVATSPPIVAQDMLNAALPKNATRNGRRVYHLDSNGVVRAERGIGPDMFGTSLFDLTGGAYTMTTLGAEETQTAFRMGGEQRVFAILNRLPLEAGGGALAVTQTRDSVFTDWWGDLYVELLLLALFFLITGAVVLLYLREAGRTRLEQEAKSWRSAQFDSALLRGHCGLWTWDIARGRISWSKSMFQLLGLPLHERTLSYARLTRLLHPRDADLLKVIDKTFGGDNHVDHRFRIRGSEGAWVWMRLRGEVVHGDDGDCRLVGIAFDISEQEALKQQSRNAGRRLADAVESISEAFVLWDSQKRLVMCNSKYRLLYQLEEKDAAPGRHYDELMNLGVRPSVRMHKPLDQTSDVATRVFEAETEDGHWLQISERKTHDGGFVSVGTDVTQFKRAQERAEKTERNHEATIDAYKQSQKQLELQALQLVELATESKRQRNRAEAANRTKSQFLANVSHELRTPLNAIIGFSDIMKSRTFGPIGSDKYGEYAEDIHHSGTFLLNVINDVLDMSKIEAGRLKLQPEEMNVHTLITESLRIVHVQADQANIEINHKVPEDLIITADKRAVKQIIINLLSNAVKFTPEGGRVDVTVKPLRNSVNIVIEDNGIGIGKEALKRLGQPFEQVQDQFTKDHKGSGLGLAIARSLAQLHGGALKIRSRVGKGTLIAVRLPNECQQPDAEIEKGVAA